MDKNVSMIAQKDFGLGNSPLNTDGQPNLVFHGRPSLIISHPFTKCSPVVPWIKAIEIAIYFRSSRLWGVDRLCPGIVHALQGFGKLLALTLQNP